MYFKTMLVLFLFCLVCEVSESESDVTECMGTVSEMFIFLKSGEYYPYCF